MSLVDHNIVGRSFLGGNGSNGNQIGTTSNPVLALLGDLQNNGGPTETHALLAGSPALDAGDPLLSTTADQRGILRPSGVAPDIGAYEEFVPQVDFCSGDGGNQMGCTNCPCGNNAAAGTIGGCLNSAGVSAQLAVSGSTSVSLPSMVAVDLRIAAANLPSFKFSVLTSGDAVAPIGVMNPCLGMDSGTQAAPFDGLRCAVLNIRRHGGRAADANGAIGVTTNPWGGEAAPPGGLAQAGSGFVAGQTRYFEAIYRDNVLQVCMRGLNTTQAVEVTFGP